MKKCIFICALLSHSLNFNIFWHRFYFQERSHAHPITTNDNPEFADPIYLIGPRNFDKQGFNIPATILAWLKEQANYKKIEALIGRQLTQTAHDEKRKEVYTGSVVPASHIVLLHSGCPTLNETVFALKNAGLAHHFIIDLNGNIHPVTQENESIEDALKHRFYNVGISGRVVNGCFEQRDMNTASISISLVGTGETATTHEQNESLKKLIIWLQEKYQISSEKIVDYGCIAFPYGRRNISSNLPWQLLATQEIATFPTVDPKKLARYDFYRIEDITRWSSAALRKIGFLTPITHSPLQQEYQAALLCFQKFAQCKEQTGHIDDETVQKLNQMIIQHESYNPKLKEIEPPALEQC